MAAGFAVSRDQLTALGDFLGRRFAALNTGLDPVPELGIDGVVRPESCTDTLCRTLSALGPFGAGNAEPRFVLSHAMVDRADPVGTNHVRCFLSAAGARERIKAIAFRALDTPLGEALLRAGRGGPPLHVAGHLRADTWQGRSDVQLIIDDAAWPTG
jgi:single-stranded-DNA-specific exonuclease